MEWKKGQEGAETWGRWGRRIEKDERRKMNNAADSNLPVPVYLHRICQGRSVFALGTEVSRLVAEDVFSPRPEERKQQSRLKTHN